MIKLAQEKCKEWHSGQKRKYTGEPYHVHPFEVADILKKNGASEEVVAAGYLHDVVEDCDVAEADVRALFGDRIADLVMMVTDKQSDIAILRTLGMSPRSVMGIFMVQGTLIGLIGTAMGVVGGVLGLRGAELVMLGYNTPVHYPPAPEHDHLQDFHNHLSMMSFFDHHDLDSVKMRLAMGEPTLNLKDARGMTLLHYVCHYSSGIWRHFRGFNHDGISCSNCGN